MQPGKTPGRSPGEGFPSRRIVLVLLAAMFVVILVGKLFKNKTLAPGGAASPMGTWTASMPVASHSREVVRVGGPSSHSSAAFASQQTPQEIVAGKVMKFAKNRREVARAMAKRLNVKVPDEVERFFDAVEGGRWDEIDAAHKALLEDDKQLNQPKSAELASYRPNLEAFRSAGAGAALEAGR